MADTFCGPPSNNENVRLFVFGFVHYRTNLYNYWVLTTLRRSCMHAVLMLCSFDRRQLWRDGEQQWRQVRRSRFTAADEKLFLFRLWLKQIDWKLKVKLGKPIIRRSAVTVLCRFQLDVAELWAPPSAVDLVVCLSSSFGRCNLKWGLSKSKKVKVKYEILI